MAIWDCPICGYEYIGATVATACPGCGAGSARLIKREGTDDIIEDPKAKKKANIPGAPGAPAAPAAPAAPPAP